MELFIAITLGVCFGFGSYLSANRFAHNKFESSFLWLLVITSIVVGLLCLTMPAIALVGTYMLITSVLVIRKVIRHRKNTNRITIAKAYQNWLYIFYVATVIAVFIFLWIQHNI